MYRSLVAALEAIIGSERANLDAVGLALVDEILAPQPDWRQLRPRIDAWLGRRPHPVLDGGHDGAVQRDPRVARYASARRLLHTAEVWRQADPQVGGPKVFALLQRVSSVLPELRSILDAWPASAAVERPAALRDPGAGTGHREW